MAYGWRTRTVLASTRTLLKPCALTQCALYIIVYEDGSKSMLGVEVIGKLPRAVLLLLFRSHSLSSWSGCHSSK